MTYRPARCISLSEGSLLWIACKSLLARLIAVTAVFALVFGFMLSAKRISAADAAISLLVVAAVFAAVHAPDIEMLLSLKRSIRRIPAFNQIFQNKQLCFEDGSWRYCDDTLLLDLCAASAFLLYAPQIDFTKQMKLENTQWSIIHARTYACYLLFTDTNGKLQKMRVSPSGQLYMWISARGGSL